MSPKPQSPPAVYAARCIALGLLLGILGAGWDRACATLEQSARMKGRQDLEQRIFKGENGKTP